MQFVGGRNRPKCIGCFPSTQTEQDAEWVARRALSGCPAAAVAAPSLGYWRGSSLRCVGRFPFHCETDMMYCVFFLFVWGVIECLRIKLTSTKMFITVNSSHGEVKKNKKKPNPVQTGNLQIVSCQTKLANFRSQL